MLSLLLVNSHPWRLLLFFLAVLIFQTEQKSVNNKHTNKIKFNLYKSEMDEIKPEKAR